LTELLRKRIPSEKKRSFEREKDHATSLCADCTLVYN